ncbi:MAG: pectate lyase [Tepidisphaeraceae bacterium]
MKPSAATRAAGSKGGPRQYMEMPPEWYGSPEAKAIAKVVIGNQAKLGGWPKNVDTTKPINKDPAKIEGTFDNNATFDELRLLAKIHTATKDDSLLPSINKGLDLVLISQYPTGGWPQSYPPDKSYHRYITFNDGSMARLLFFVKETLESADFKFIDATRKASLQKAFDGGVDCILKCQIKVDGKLTAWCAQHDEIDYRPREGRAFEPVSISGNESIGIVHLLMAIKNPSPEVIRAVDAAAVWFDAVKIPGIRTEDRKTPGGEYEKDRFVIEDPSAPPMWARFYEIGTNKPIFSDRDSKIYYKLSDIGHERRNGYRWLSYWPANFVAKEYPEWKAQHPTP